MLTQVVEGVRAWISPGERRSCRRPVPSQPKQLSGLAPYPYQELEACTWQFSQRLSSGAVGVYRGFLRGVDVAVKVLEDADGSFYDEVRALSRLRHPNLARLHGWGTHEHKSFLVFELLAGGSLLERLERKEFLWQQRLRAAAQAAAGLTYMVSIIPRIFHRDIRPANVLFDRSGTAKMAGYGESGAVKVSG
ncbi:WAKL14 [Symbiodinium natans]|uniref:WAKL14 protein n=1 Tax=Symbiodinium natans TaxID=878477 RepID=A0A812LTU6_9DINO|nr:WAKL14 [Symbiodinium natans]